MSYRRVGFGGILCTDYYFYFIYSGLMFVYLFILFYWDWDCCYCYCYDCCCCWLDWDTGSGGGGRGTNIELRLVCGWIISEFLYLNIKTLLKNCKASISSWSYPRSPDN